MRSSVYINRVVVVRSCHVVSVLSCPLTSMKLCVKSIVRQHPLISGVSIALTNFFSSSWLICHHLTLIPYHKIENVNLCLLFPSPFSFALTPLPQNVHHHYSHRVLWSDFLCLNFSLRYAPVCTSRLFSFWFLCSHLCMFRENTSTVPVCSHWLLFRCCLLFLLFSVSLRRSYVQRWRSIVH